jgi:hypothetical protein
MLFPLRYEASPEFSFCEFRWQAASDRWLLLHLVSGAQALRRDLDGEPTCVRFCGVGVTEGDYENVLGARGQRGSEIASSPSEA